jgi:hypothetical protein
VNATKETKEAKVFDWDDYIDSLGPVHYKDLEWTRQYKAKEFDWGEYIAHMMPIFDDRFDIMSLVNRKCDS